MNDKEAINLMLRLAKVDVFIGLKNTIDNLKRQIAELERQNEQLRKYQY